MSDSQLILHVKGTEDQTKELPRQVVRAAIAQGQISRSQLIWSAAHKAWKQVRELPELLPSQKLAPAPTARPRVATGALPKVATGALPKVASGGLPKIAAPQYQTGGIPRVTAKDPAARPATSTAAVSPDYRVAEEHEGMHPFLWMGIGLGILIVLIVGANYLLVDQPLVSQMSHTPYAQVTVYGHLGGFMQPSALVIHLPSSSAVTSGNLASFLMTLAQSTPNEPLSSEPFERVSLTSAWTGQYSIPGHVWKMFGDMGREDAEQQKNYLLDHLEDTSGKPLVASNPDMDDVTRQALRDKVWAAFARNFTGE